VARLIERHGERFIDRVYTSAELRYCQTRQQSTQQFAAQWAAKEAIFKALGTRPGRGVRWLDVEVLPDKRGRLSAKFRGGLAELTLGLGIGEMLVTTSHSRGHAIAYAMALGRTL
jgi:holo-[acyl-carrier protein] synthase